MKEVALSEVKDDLSRYLRQAAKEEIVITRHGKAAGLLIGFESDDDWFDYRLENDPRFLHRVGAARESLRAGQGVKLEDVGRVGGPVPNNALRRPVSRVTALAEKRKGRATRARR